jgi:hypothetical protein
LNDGLSQAEVERRLNGTPLKANRYRLPTKVMLELIEGAATR